MHTLLSLLLALTAATAQPNAAAVDRVVDDWHKAAADADEARYFGYAAPEFVFLGTDATERWDLASFRAFAHPYFAKGKAWTFTPRNRHVTFSPAGDVAWFDESLDSASYGECRGSGVLRKRSEEHTSELQSPCNLVCRLLLEKKNTLNRQTHTL